MQRAPQVEAQTSEETTGRLAIHSATRRHVAVRSAPTVRRSFENLALDSARRTNLPKSILRAEENERKRIGRDLHDEMGQRLMALRFYLGTLVKQAAGGPLKPRAEEALSLLDETIDGLRRIIGSLSPRALENLGLIGAIRKEAKTLSKQTGMAPHLAFPKNLGTISHEIELALYRTVQEALNNISKHSHAKNFGVAIEQHGDRLTMRIDDDGSGFSRNLSVRDSFGITGMNGRIKELDGTMRVRSRKGGGTIVLIEVPFVRSDGHTQKDLRHLAVAARAS